MERVDAAVAMVKFLKDAEAAKEKEMVKRGELFLVHPLHTTVALTPRALPVTPPEPDVKIRVVGRDVRFSYTKESVGRYIASHIGFQGRLIGDNLTLRVSTFTDMEALVDWIEYRFRYGGFTVERV